MVTRALRGVFKEDIDAESISSCEESDLDRQLCDMDRELR